MATMPTDMPMPPEAMTEDQAEMPAEEAGEGGITVCIRISGDGSMSVGIEPPESPEVAAEEYGGFQAVQTLDEALEAVRGLVEGAVGGGAEEKPLMDGEEEFVAGFKGVRGGAGGY